MKNAIFLLAASLLLSGAAPGTNEVIRTTSDLKSFHAGTCAERRRFDLSGTVTRANPEGGVFILEDASGRVLFTCRNPPFPQVGDVIHIKGSTRLNDRLESWDFPEEMTVLGRRPPQPPKFVRIGEIDETRDDLRAITTEGTLIDVLPDEIDRRYTILSVLDGWTLIPVFTDREKSGLMRRSIGARVGVTGLYQRSGVANRSFSRPFIFAARDGGTAGAGDEVRIIAPPEPDFGDVPELTGISGRTPEDLKRLGRCKFTGEVLATWGGSHVMVRKDANFVSNVELVRDCPLPSVGEWIVVAGYPETDFFRINLGKARWLKAEPGAPSADERPQSVRLQEILDDETHLYTETSPRFHGRLVSISGMVRAISSEGGIGRQAILGCGNSNVTVDYSSTPDALEDVTVGCVVEVTGRCLLKTSNYSLYERFPQIAGVAILPRSRDDIVVLDRPSWWTPARLLGVIAGLVALLAVFLVWNRVLNRLVDRRSRELFRAEVAKVGSELRIGERTRLAVELHDSLSQSLTGVAMKIKAAERCGTTDPDRLFHHLGIAEKVLQSCRDELRNSLWDLRSQALEDADLNRAISRTLLPHVENVKLSVRFDVRRSMLTDNTTHDILRIVRELAVNGIRHGRATAVKIAGCIEGGKLLVSVTDNGCGFDPEKSPGVREGHFGIQGVRERLGRFGGTLDFESRPGCGTKAIVTLNIPNPSKKDVDKS